MWNMNEIRHAEYVRDYVVFVEFDDGTAGEVDLAPYLNRGPIFRPLVDRSFFKRFALEGGTLSCPNGADIAPERLYELAVASNKPVS